MTQTPRSLHARLIVGVLVWVVGLLVTASVIGYHLIEHRIASPLLVHNSLLALTGAVLVTAGLSVIRRELSPFRMLRERLAAVRDGRTARLEGTYPTEVEPLVKDLNLLLDERARRVEQAAARAGDLAHGLKTPLAIVAQDVTRVEALGERELAGSLRRQVERMRRQIETHLAQARAAALGQTIAARAEVAESVRGLLRTMERLHAERSLRMSADVPAALVVRVPLEDLDEMLGNLLDNACKWARSHVAVSASAVGDRVVIDVTDDGAGLDPAMSEQVLQRGVRADEAAPGSGFGLAIVRDLADAYGGTIVLDRSPAGGVRARLTLPAHCEGPPTSN